MTGFVDEGDQRNVELASVAAPAWKPPGST
jgi:hypothetical protein